MKFVHTQVYDGKSRPDLQGTKITADCRCFIEVIDALEMADFPSEKLQALVQHLECLTAHYSATKAAGALKSQKEDDYGIKQRAGFEWHCMTATLVAKLEPWTVRESGAEKAAKEQAAIIHKIDEKIRSGEVPEAMRAMVAQLAGYKGTPPPYKASFV